MSTTLQNVNTPCLVIDAQIARRNLEGLAQYVKQKRINLRPHTKTHKSQKLARMQIEYGAAGLTVAKAGEAKVMAQAGNDVLMAYPGIGAARATALAELAQRITVHDAIDSTVAADGLAEAALRVGSTIGILVEIDVGMHRTGVQSPRDALALAQHVARSKGLRLDGIMFYPGHVREKPDQQAEPLAKISAILQETIDLWRKSGLEAKIVSGGSTPTMFQSHLIPQVTEIRPGTYIFNDLNTVYGGFCTLDDCAARVLCTVVSDAYPGQVVVDAGCKTFSSDRCIPAMDSGHGYVVEYPEAKIPALYSEEHGMLDMKACPRRPKIGQRLSVIPNHICSCVNMHDVMWWKDGDTLEPITIDARGKLT